ncbi:MAG: cytochrome c oxidase assembly protein, partial [Phycisphaerales bacterium]|nr:cytochrome c oxidase assembly protein [Phycisphaerales bacterium]
HLCFLIVSLLFWWPVMQPWPTSHPWPTWVLVVYLLIADVQNTVFSAAFTFWRTPIYDLYANGPRLGGITALADQATAGAIMWVAGSAAFLLPVGWLIVRAMRPTLALPAGPRGGPTSTTALPLLGGTGQPSRGDLFATPVIGGMLRSAKARRCVQIVLLLLAVAIVIDGLRGPRTSAMNLAGVLPWTHWRGFVVLGLLLAGNLFCWSCPFMVPRDLAKRLRLDRLSWPHWLRTKWLAVALLVVFLWAYETLALWDSPWWTAWIIIGYFIAATVIDAFFKGASFCKWVCPIGQFHFVQSLCAPRSLQVRDETVCTACDTHDCINGNATSRGCGTGLFLPAKRGGMDCTWCMDCVQACPHDNIALQSRTTASDLRFTRWRGGVGRLFDRPDALALMAVLLAGAFVNAAGMTGPVLAWEDALTARWGLQTTMVPSTIVVIAGIVVVPAIALPVLGGLGTWMGGRRVPLRIGTGRLIAGLLPLGFAMWFVHMLFHLVTAFGSAVPAAHRALNALDVTTGTPNWLLGCCLALPDWLVPLELLMLNAGVLVSIIVLHALAGPLTRHGRRGLTFGLWSCTALAIWAAGVWIVLQPMQMRGTLLP